MKALFQDLILPITIVVLALIMSDCVKETERIQRAQKLEATK